MEIIAKPKGGLSIDKMAEKVFEKSIELLGGLKHLIEYRNLTWLPSLAEAAYVIVLKNEAFKTYSEIARELGITEQTVKAIATANEQEVLKYLEMKLKGETLPKEKREHTAGGIAKLAYKSLKEAGLLEEEAVEVKHEEIEVLDIAWAVAVLKHIKGLDFPVEKEDLKSRLAGLVIKGRKIEELLEEIEYPVKTPAELLKKLKEKLG
ncbi:MAG: KaiC associated regulatory domain-containing protein [Candidatus Aenigmarchaeota archaeon ex4484_224]|nr:MAG: KaiC associated regulatory domain-containing protein [Candidatus Aenigmarchaeota archaeon ex4484_224]